MPKVKLDLTNQRFGKLTVMYETIPLQGKYHLFRRWYCLCDCGNTTNVVQGDLRSGDTRSCGCLKLISPAKTHGKSNTHLYSVWKGMLRRCSDTKHIKSMRNYISQGITVCPEWESLDIFEEWSLNNGYSPNLSLDRIDGNLNYSPENCRWVTEDIQSRNRKKLVNTTSQYIGVSFDKTRNKWFATVHVANKKAFHKRFNTELEAAKARDAYIKDKSLQGFKLNF
jgi:hypothetical protein